MIGALLGFVAGCLALYAYQIVMHRIRVRRLRNALRKGLAAYISADQRALRKGGALAGRPAPEDRFVASERARISQERAFDLYNVIDDTGDPVEGFDRERDVYDDQRP